jgi:hypothetical protein
MSDAATPTGGAEGSARPQAGAAQATPQAPAQPVSVQDRLKASMFESAPPPKAKQPQSTTGQFVKGAREIVASEDGGVPDDIEAPTAAPDGDQSAEDTTGAVDNDGAEAEQEAHEAAIKSLTDLAEGLAWDMDKVLDLDVPVKINGKEGKVPLRDALKSYQLEGHLNQGLMKLAEERKGFEGETSRKVQEIQARVGQLNQAVGLAQKILDGEFADVNWQELQRTDPAGFQAKYGAYKMRQDGIQQLNQMVMQEQQSVTAQEQAAKNAYLAEQAKLLDSKLPEWADTGKRDKDVTEMVAILSDAYGLTEQEIRGSTDHRLILIARDAMRWQKLQKSKPATLQKVRAAPKLIRPGSQQSRTAQAGLQYGKDRENLRRTGRTQDAIPALKKLIFN